MPVYKYHCNSCDEDHDVLKPVTDCARLESCPVCDRKMRRVFTSFGLSGINSGPGSGCNELIFDRPDPVKDGEITLKKMEASGGLKDPKSIAAAKMKMNSLKKKQHTFVRRDYGKEGHPIETKRSH